MAKHTSRTRRAARLAALMLLGGLTIGGAVSSAASADETAPPKQTQTSDVSAAKWKIRYQSWSQVPGNRAGVVFRPHGDKFETWDHRDGYRSTVYWNYKGINDGWKKIRLQDGAHATYDRNLREGRHIYFIVQTDRHQSPSYVSEYRTSGR